MKVFFRMSKNVIFKDQNVRMKNTKTVLLIIQLSRLLSKTCEEMEVCRRNARIQEGKQRMNESLPEVVERSKGKTMAR